MLKFQEFVDKYINQFVDTDGAYGGQCMDLMHAYCRDVLGLSDLSILAADCAKNVYKRFPNIKGSEYFEKIDNTPEGMPQEGDIIFWGNGQWGHVAICLFADLNRFTSFDQNYPTGSKCHSVIHGYVDVVGWLRFKKYTNVTKPVDTDTTMDTQTKFFLKQMNVKTLDEALAVYNEQVGFLVEERKKNTILEDKLIGMSQAMDMAYRNGQKALLDSQEQLEQCIIDKKILENKPKPVEKTPIDQPKTIEVVPSTQDNGLITKIIKFLEKVAIKIYE